MQRWIMLVVTVCAMRLSAFAVDANQDLLPGSYQIRNRKFGELLRPENANTANGTRMVLYPAQLWKCMTWKLLPKNGATFYLQNHFTDKTFEASTNLAGAVVVQVPLAREVSARAAWCFKKLSDGFYQITDERSGRCLTASVEDVIRLSAFKEAPEQEWELLPTDPAQLTM